MRFLKHLMARKAVEAEQDYLEPETNAEDWDELENDELEMPKMAPVPESPDTSGIYVVAGAYRGGFDEDEDAEGFDFDDEDDEFDDDEDYEDEDDYEEAPEEALAAGEDEELELDPADAASLAAAAAAAETAAKRAAEVLGARAASPAASAQRERATTELRDLLSRVATPIPDTPKPVAERVPTRQAKIWDLPAEDEDGDELSGSIRVNTQMTLRAVEAAANASMAPPDVPRPLRTLSTPIQRKTAEEFGLRAPEPATAPAPEPVRAAAPAAPAPRPASMPELPPAPSMADIAARMPAPPPPRPTPAPAVAGAPPAGRQKTRLLGFHQAPVAADVFDTPATPAPVANEAPRFPTGWIVVMKGPGRGASFTLGNGVSQMGRGEDQAIRLDFGDLSISRNNHAAVAFDSEMGRFFLGHGGKTNLVRLNGRPVLSTEELETGDEIRIGETVLRFVAFCGEDFNWGEEAEHDDGSVSA